MPWNEAASASLAGRAPSRWFPPVLDHDLTSAGVERLAGPLGRYTGPELVACNRRRRGLGAGLRGAGEAAADGTRGARRRRSGSATTRWLTRSRARFRLAGINAGHGGGIAVKGFLVSVIALVFLVLFVSVWGWIAYDLWQFDPSPSKRTLEVDARVVEVAGFVAATVAAGTAAFLGIEIQKRPPGVSLANWLKTAHAAKAALLALGVFAYLGIGALLFVLWLTEPEAEATPDFIGAFAWGFLGWAAGAFTAVFAAEGGGGLGGPRAAAGEGRRQFGGEDESSE